MESLFSSVEDGCGLACLSTTAEVLLSGTMNVCRNSREIEVPVGKDITYNSGCTRLHSFVFAVGHREAT